MDITGNIYELLLEGRRKMRKPIQIPEEKIVLPILALVRAVTDLVNYGRIIRDDRWGRRETQRWMHAYYVVFQFQEELITKTNWEDTETQFDKICKNLTVIQDMTNIKLWRSFCGRSHTVPVEKIQKVKEELENFKLKIKK